MLFALFSVLTFVLRAHNSGGKKQTWGALAQITALVQLYGSDSILYHHAFGVKNKI